MNHQDTKTPSRSPRKDLSAAEERVAEAVVDAAVKVHSMLGPGLLESVYQTCLEHELKLRGFEVKREVAYPVHYEGLVLEGAFRADMVVEGLVVVEVKTVEGVLPVHLAQLLTYLKLSGLRLGFLLNFNERLMKDGVYRRVL